MNEKPTIELVWPEDTEAALDQMTKDADQFQRTHPHLRRPPLPLPVPETPLGHVARELREFMFRNEMPTPSRALPAQEETGRVPIIGRDRGAPPGTSPEDVVGSTEEPRRTDLRSPSTGIPAKYLRYRDQILRGDPTWEAHRVEILGPSSNMSDVEILDYAAQHEPTALALLQLYHCGGEIRDPEEGWRRLGDISEGWDRRRLAFDRYLELKSKRRPPPTPVDHTTAEALVEAINEYADVSLRDAGPVSAMKITRPDGSVDYAELGTDIVAIREYIEMRADQEDWTFDELVRPFARGRQMLEEQARRQDLARILGEAKARGARQTAIAEVVGWSPKRISDLVR